jgi:hypothetical protein
MIDDEEFEFDDYTWWEWGYCWTCGFLGRFKIFDRLVSRHLRRQNA